MPESSVVISVAVVAAALAFLLAIVAFWARRSKVVEPKLPVWQKTLDGVYAYKDGRVDKRGDGWTYVSMITFSPENNTMLLMFRLLWVKDNREVPFTEPESMGRVAIKTEECYRWISMMGDRDFEGWWTVKMPLDLTKEVREFKENMYRASRGDCNFAVEFPVGPISGQRTIKIMSGQGLEELFQPQKQGVSNGNKRESNTAARTEPR